MSTTSRVLRAVVALCSFACLTAAAHAAPVVLFDMADVPTVVTPGPTVYTVRLRYSVAGNNLRDARIAIDLPAGVIPVGAGHDPSFTGGCELDDPSDVLPSGHHRSQDWRCAWAVPALAVPQGGLSGQIALSVVYRRWGHADGAVLTLAPSFTATWDNGGVATSVGPLTASAATTIDGQHQVAFGVRSWELSSAAYGYTTIDTAQGPVTGVLSELLVEVRNQGAIGVAEGYRIEADLPAGAVFAGTRTGNGTFVASTSLGSSGTVRFVASQPLGVASAFPGIDPGSGETYAQSYQQAELQWFYLRAVVPCTSMPLAPNERIALRLVGAVPGVVADSQLATFSAAPGYGLNGSPDIFLCGKPSRSEMNSTGFGAAISQSLQVVHYMHGPTGAVPVYDAFASTYLPPVFSYTNGTLSLASGTVDVNDVGFELYACALPVVAPITRAEFEDVYRADCTLVPLPQDSAVPADTTHLVVYLDDEDAWLVEDPLGPTVPMGLEIRAWGFVDRCMDQAPLSFTATSYVEASDGTTRSSDTSDYTFNAPNTHTPSWHHVPNPATATRGQRQSLGFMAAGSFAPLKNPVVTMPVPAGVVVADVRPMEDGRAGCVPPPLDWSIANGTLTIRNGTTNAPWYHDASCNLNGCNQGGMLAFTLDAYFDPQHPFLNGQLVSFAATVTGANLTPNSPGSATSTTQVVMQVPAEKRLVLEPACLDQGGNVATGVRTRFVNSGGVPLSNLVVEVPLPRIGDGSGTEVDALLQTATTTLGVLTCSANGTSFGATCDASTRFVRVTVATLQPHSEGVVTLYFAPNASAAAGDVVRHTASLRSDLLLPIDAPPGPPARWGLCPGNLHVEGWFDDGATPATRDVAELGLAQWKVRFADRSDPTLRFEVTLPAGGVLDFAVGPGTYDVSVVPDSADGAAQWTYRPALPASVTVASALTSTLRFGAICGCDDGELCTIDSCTFGGVCGHQPDDVNPACVTECGNGVREGDEQCDTGVEFDFTNGCLDCECSALGFRFEPNIGCVPICGDNHRFGGEQCDDGNTNNGDGCSNACRVEANWTCEAVVDQCPPTQLCGASRPAWCTYEDPSAPGQGEGDWCALLADGQLLGDFDFCAQDGDCTNMDCLAQLDTLDDEAYLACLYTTVTCQLCDALGPSTCTPNCVPSAEVCNDLDDDCDGIADDGLTRTTTCGTGACAANAGIETCVAGTWGNDTCDAFMGATSEQCNNVDDDCDGATDEQLTRATTCGVGVCAGNVGVESCLTGAWTGNTCDPRAGRTGEVCNDLDDDCDGLVDATRIDVNGTVFTGSVCAALDTQILTAPMAVTAATTATFTYIYPGAPAHRDFECVLDGGPWVACDGGTVSFTQLGPGQHTFVVRTVDGADVDESPAEHVWTIDMDVPDTFIVSGPDDPTGATTASFTLDASIDAIAGYFCALDPVGGEPAPADYAPCPANVSFDDLDDGSHTLWAYVVSTAGVADPSPATYTWVVVSGVPETVIDSAPTGQSGQTTTSDAATFDYSDPTDPTRTTFMCSLDGGTWRACSGTSTYPDLTDGTHTFSVYAIEGDAVDPSPATWTWDVDTTPPETTIVSGPADTTEATFVFESNEAPVTFTCALMPAGMAPQAWDYPPCAATTTVDVAPGDYVMWVYATDAAGTSDATPATWAWTVSSDAPDTVITDGPASVVSSGDASFTFESPTGHAHFECRVDGGAWFACDAGTWTADVADGAHTFEVRACDGDVCDATPATHEWTVAPCADASAPAMTCVSEVTYACGLVVEPTTFGPAVDDTCGVTTTYESPEAWALGSNEVTFTAEDAAGNRATCVTTVVIADTIAPALACADATLSTPAGACAVSPTFAATDACGPVDVTVTPAQVGPGATTVSVAATDVAGNVATCTSVVTVVDDTAPVASCGSVEGDLPRTIRASATDACAVDVAIDDVTCVVAGSARDDCAVSVDGRALVISAAHPDGPATVSWTVTATDASGNRHSVACSEAIAPPADSFTETDGCSAAHDTWLALLGALAMLGLLRRSRA